MGWPDPQQGCSDPLGLPRRPLRAGYPPGPLGERRLRAAYEEVEGDSASSAELYAILSSLSGLPINQGLAVTGSVNQQGRGPGHRGRQRQGRGVL